MKQLTIDGVPVAKGRPRLGRYGTYTPKKTQEYEEYVKACWVSKYGAIQPSEQPLEVYIVFYMPMGKSWTKRKTEEYKGRLHTNKPDIDNLVKAVLDGLNGVAYKDDKQIGTLSVVKRWAVVGKTEVWIKEVE